MDNYNKSPFTTSQLIQKLQDRGLIFSDRQGAEHFLFHVSYYRLRPYIIPFQNDTKEFHESTDFEHIIELYEFDSKLRFLLLETIEKIEISIRSVLVNTYSLSHGTNWYEDSSLFKDPIEHTKLLNIIDKMLGRSSKEQFIAHYNSKYNNPPRPPSWMIFEIITFGTLSNIFAQLNEDQAKKRIAKKFGLRSPIILKSWLHTLTYIRNTVAHHSRLWNRTLQIKPMKPKKPLHAWIDPRAVKRDRLYLTISCIQYMLNTISSNNSFSDKLKSLFEEYPSIDLQAMNFPTNWQEQSLWQ